MSPWRVMRVRPGWEPEDFLTSSGAMPPPPPEMAHLPMAGELLAGAFETRAEAREYIAELEAIPGNEEASFRVVFDVSE